MASQQERNARLDQLKVATDAWASNRTKILQKESTLLKKILKGRTGADRLNNASVEAASDLLVDEISQFLNGE